MATKLTWSAGRKKGEGRWKKIYKGKLYYFSAGTGKYDTEAERKAKRAFEEIVARVNATEVRPHEEKYLAAITEWENAQSYFTRIDDLDNANMAFKKAEFLRDRLRAPKLSPLRKTDRFDSLLQAAPGIKLPEFTVGGAVQASISASGEVQVSHDVELPGLKVSLSPEDLKAYSDELDGSPARIEREILKHNVKLHSNRHKSTDKTVGRYVQDYFDKKYEDMQAGGTSPSRAGEVLIHLGKFKQWIGQDFIVTDIDGPTLIDYRTFLMEMVKQGEWKPKTAHSYLGTLKAFVRWLWTIEAISALPRVMDSKSNELKINVPRGEIQVFSLDEITHLLTEAKERTKLYILLMLNCAFTQVDIATLRNDEVDWENGRITRKRTKTVKYEGVPTVDYALWSQTFELLKLEKAEDETQGLVLLNQNGSPLRTETLSPGGKFKRTDNIKNSMDRLKKKLDIKIPLKALKKTSASLLRNSERFSGLESLFLGHSPRSMAHQHYAQVPQDLLDAGIQWLGEQYGLVD